MSAERSLSFDNLLCRREFLKDLGLAGAVALLAVTGGCEQIIEIIENRPTRKNIDNLGPSDPMIVAYKAAITAMKTLYTTNPTDQRNWVNQALIHNNHCPHGNWYFLPWHRAYLLYFERICRKYSGNPNFALPYWNWTSSPTVPAVFWDGTSGSCPAICPPTSVSTPANPLFDCSRGITSSDAVSSAFVGTTVMESILEEPNFFNFASDQAVGQRDFAGYGLLEGTPHNSVHGFIGGYMGAFCSPMDPVFWTHHCMIDACWVNWNITRGNPNTNDSSWLNFPLVDFVDENNTPVNIPIVDTLLYPLLAYQYEPSQMGTTVAQAPASNQLLASLRSESSMSLAFANAFAAADSPQGAPANRKLSKSETKTLVNFLKQGAPVKLEYSSRYELARSLSVEVGRPVTGSIRIEPDKVRAALDAQSRNRLYLTVAGITMPERSDEYVRVFLNKPDASTDTPLSDPHYAGSFAFFVGEHNMHSDTASNAGFIVDTTDTLRKLNQVGSLSENVDVQLVPMLYEHRKAEGEQFTLQKLALGIAPPPNVKKLQLTK
jgi:tyrosinase